MSTDGEFEDEIQSDEEPFDSADEDSGDGSEDAVVTAAQVPAVRAGEHDVMHLH
jgi:hypothetical protein